MKLRYFYYFMTALDLLPPAEGVVYQGGSTKSKWLDRIVGFCSEGSCDAFGHQCAVKQTPVDYVPTADFLSTGIPKEHAAAVREAVSLEDIWVIVVSHASIRSYLRLSIN